MMSKLRPMLNNQELPMLDFRRFSETSVGVKAASAALIGAVFLGLGGCEDQSAKQSDASTTRIPIVNVEDPLIELATFVSAESVEPERAVVREQGSLKRRETLIDVLDRMGADRRQSNGAVHAAAKHIDMRRLRPGQKVTAYFEQAVAADEADPILAGLTFHPEPGRRVLVNKTSTGAWVSRELQAKLIPSHEKVGGTINSSIYELARSQGAGDQQVVDFAEIFAYDVDFQREIRPGDTFEIAYETFSDERGDKIKAGNVLYASLNGTRVKRNFYRFTTTDDGITDYYDEKGQSARKFLMKTPINGARLSSHFGRRRHPVLGYTKMHKGTDFAAPRGTPIYAAGNGVIERASRWGSFGHYIRIRHANGYKTAYAHLNGYAKGIKKGRRVKQGQVIGYVGTTGRSTGPHLHYEVMVNGKHVNAMRLKLPTGRKLKGDMLDAFKVEKARIDAVRGTLPPYTAEHAASADGNIPPA